MMERSTAIEQGEIPNSRADDRSNVFVMATLYSATSSAPVRIRNMSRNGALVEGGVLPSEGKEMRLCRGSLSVSGRIVWRNGNRAGLRFDSTIFVADWLPRGNRNSDQQRVDEIVFQAKGGSSQSEDAEPATREAAIAERAGIAAQLKQFANTLDRIAGDFAEDAIVTSRFQIQLQLLDVIAKAAAGLALAMDSPRFRED